MATRQWKNPRDLGESPPPAVLPGSGGKVWAKGAVLSPAHNSATEIMQ